jgi:hypothetical protein
MEKDVAKRLESAREMLDALRAIQTGRTSQPSIPSMKGTVKMHQPSSPSWGNVPVAAPAPTPPASTPSVRGTLPMNAFPVAPQHPPPTKPRSPPRALYWVVIAALLLATAAIGGLALYLSR